MHLAVAFDAQSIDPIPDIGSSGIVKMQIGELARAGGCQVVTVRYYERVGVLPPPARAANNYRQYGHGHLRRLRFVRRTRELGFTLEEVREMLALIEGGTYTCEDMRDLAQEHLTEIHARLEDLKRMEATLSDLIARCHGGATPDCSMLESLFTEANDEPVEVTE